MVSFVILRRYLGIKTVPCGQLLRIARMDRDWNLKKLGQPFEDQMPLMTKCSLMKFQFDIFFNTLQKYFIYG